MLKKCWKIEKFSKFQFSRDRVQCVSECQWRYLNGPPSSGEVSEAPHDHRKRILGEIFWVQIWSISNIAKNSVFWWNHDARGFQDFGRWAHSNVILRPEDFRYDQYLQFGSSDCRENTLGGVSRKSIFHDFSFLGSLQRITAISVPR